MAYEKISEIENKISKLQKELAIAKREAEKYDKLPIEKQVAILLHEKLCHWDHTDGCGWFYYKDIDDDAWLTDYSRKLYLERASNVINVASRAFPIGQSIQKSVMFNHIRQLLDAMTND